MRKSFFWYIGSVLTSIVVFWRWFLPGIFAAGDFTYYFVPTFSEWSKSSAWVMTGLGGASFTIWRYPLNAVFGLFGRMNVPYEIAFKLLVLWPIALCSGIVGFWFTKKMVRSHLAAYVGSLFIFTNTYVLSISTQGQLHLVVSAIFGIVSLGLYLDAVDKSLKSRLLASALFLGVAGVFDFRIAYIAIGMQALYSVIYSIFSTEGKKEKYFSLVSLGMILATFGLINTFWLLPTAFGGGGSAGTVLSRGLFGSHFFSLSRSFADFFPYWNSAQPVWFQVQRIVPSFFILPIVAFGSLLLRGKMSIKKVYFLILALIGIILTKQAAEPFPSLYAWLYGRLPGFNAFREASKFYLLTGIGYAVLAAIAIDALLSAAVRRLRILGLMASATLFLLFVSIGWVAATGRIKSMFVPRDLPTGFSELRSLYNDTGYFRTAWLPTTVRWMFFTNIHPPISQISLINTFLTQTVGKTPIDSSKFSSAASELRKSYVDYLLDISSVRYVVVPENDPIDQNFRDYGEREQKDVRDLYLEILDSLSFLRKLKLEGQPNAVYENEGASDLVKVINQPVQYIGRLANIETAFDFISKRFSFDGIFFSASKRGEFVEGAISTLAVFSNGDVLQPPVEKLQISSYDLQRKFSLLRSKVRSKKVTFKDNKFTVERVYSAPIIINGESYESAETNDERVEIKVPKDNRVRLLSVDGQPYIVSNQLSPIDFRTDKETSIIISQIVSNVVKNPSFESGSWQVNVSDCNKYDSQPIIGMKVDISERSDGLQSLQLEASRHTACVSTDVDVSGGDEYALSFDFQSPNGQNSGYYLQFNDEKHSVVREMIPVLSSAWKGYARKVAVPKGATKAKLYLYGYSRDEKEKIVTRYDNVRLGKLVIESTTKIPREEGYEKTPVVLGAGENVIEYKDPRYSYNNLFPNPSFEQSLWQSTVGDCTRYDDNASIAMQSTSQEKTDGENALELSATRHTACTLTTIPVKGGSTYAVSFDYQSPNAKIASYYIGFSDADKSSVKEDLPISGTGWQTFSGLITVPKGATTLSFYVYAKEADKVTNIINRYDNFKLIEVPDLRDAFYLVSEPERKLVEPASVTFDLINPTKKLVHIKGATTPFFLGMSESYHDQWQLQFNNANVQGWLKRWWPFAKPDRIANDAHYKLDGFLNAWYVDTDTLCGSQALCTKNADGSYDLEMVLEFWPQRWFYLGLLISGTTLAGCLGYLGYDGVRSLRRRYVARKERAPVSTESV